MISGRVPTIVITLVMRPPLQRQPRAPSRCRGCPRRTASGSRTASYLGVAGVRDVVHPHRRHVHDGWRVARDVERHDLVVEHPSQRDPGLTAEHDEALDLAEVEVLAPGDARPGRRHERLALSAVGANGLDEAPPVVRVRCERDRVVGGEECRPVGVEQVDAQGGVEGGDVTGRVELVELAQQRVAPRPRRWPSPPATRVVSAVTRASMSDWAAPCTCSRPTSRSADLGLLASRHRVDEGRDERVVCRLAVFAEDVGQADVDEVSSA